MGAMMELRLRLGAWLRKRPVPKHLGPLVILAVIHVAVMQRNLRATHGIPINTIPWDFLDSYSRLLIFISDSLREGSLPIWFPYGHAGTPLLVNPQSQLWTPVTWVLSALPGYSLLVAQWQVLLTILCGSIGVYFLAYNLWARRSSALLAAMAYNFTSARLCNAEHIDIVTAFSLFPWIFWGIKRVAECKAGARPVLGMLIGLLVVSGYPGVVLLCPLWFGGWIAWLLVSQCNDRATRKKFIAGICLSVALGLGISSGYCLPIATNLGAFSRGAPMTTDAALAQSLLPADLWHVIFGASVALVPEGVTTDRSMRGLYFGVVALMLAFHALVAHRNRTTTALGVAFLLAILMSLGKGFFARVALHDFLPVFNLSRFPAGDSRAVAALAGSLLAGGGLANVLGNLDHRWQLSRILGGGLLLLLAGTIWFGAILYPNASPPALHEVFTNVLFVELLVLLIAYIGVQRFASPVPLAICLLVASGLDAGMHAATDAGTWSVPSDARIERYVQMRSKTFDPAKALLPRVDAKALIDVASNDAYLNKSFYLASYVPFQLKRLGALVDANFREFLVRGQRIVGFVGSPPPAEGALFQKNAIAVQFQIARYLPDRVDYVVDLPVKTTLVFNEVYFPGWRAHVDAGASGPMQEVAGGLRALTVEAGHHTIATRFSPWTFWVGLVTTLLSWGLALAWLARSTFWRRKRRLPAAQATADTP